MAATDTYGKDISQVGPASNAAAVTPDDNNDLAAVSRALVIGAAGNIGVVMRGGQSVVIPVPAGVIPIAVKRVLLTGTTATGIVALW